jgi:hypothetical protein
MFLVSPRPKDPSRVFPRNWFGAMAVGESDRDQSARVSVELRFCDQGSSVTSTVLLVCLATTMTPGAALAPNQLLGNPR